MSLGRDIVGHRPIVSGCFEPGREVLAFGTREELFEILARARREPAEMEKVRDTGHRRALAEHTYEHRLKVILSSLA